MWFADFDGDGFGDRGRKEQACNVPVSFVDNALDCDDADFERNPNRVEDPCDGVDNDCDELIDEEPATMWFLDRDADGFGEWAMSFESCVPVPGYSLVAGDCDDSNPEIYPENPESCDGLDNDCDGSVDEDVPFNLVWYRDADDDDYGNAAVTTTGCLAPTGFVANNTDCNDQTALVHPTADERCDGIDNDCDLLVDDDDPDGVVDGDMVYLDFDLDGYGHPFVTAVACQPVPGWSANGDDCLDTDVTVNPNATEVCGGGDENCNGLVDDADPGVDPATMVTRWLDWDGDGLGDITVEDDACSFPVGWVTNSEDCDDSDPAVLDQGNWAVDEDGDGITIGPVIAGLDCEWPGPGWAIQTYPGDCDDDDSMVFPGQLEVCGDGVDQDCTGMDTVCAVDLSGDLSVADAPWRLDGELAGEGLGSSLAIVGDLDGDGLDDVLAGAPDADLLGTDNGLARLFLEPPREDGGSWFATSAFPGVGIDDRVGTSVGGGQDLTGDGIVDIVIGSPWRDTGGSANGAAWVLAGPAEASMAVGNGVCRLGGSSDDDWVGTALVALGDVGGDPFADLVVGAPGDDAGGSESGSVYVVNGPMAGMLDIGLVAQGQITGQGAFDAIGSAVTAAGDVNFDGLEDVLVGAPTHNGANADSGAAYLLLGPISGTVDAGVAANTIFLGIETDALAGSSLGAGADVDGDGSPDLIVGAPGGGAQGQGAAYLVVGTPAGLFDLANATAIFTGEQSTDLAGASVALADLDGDLSAEVIVGAPNAWGTGVVYVFFGGVAGSVDLVDAPSRLFGEQPGDLAGAALGAGGDVFGTGVESLFIGAPGFDLGTGAIYLFPGGF